MNTDDPNPAYIAHKTTEIPWIFYQTVNFADETIQQYHVDTRDFHVLCNPRPKEEPIDTRTLAKYPDRFFFTPEEVKALIERYFTDSGGKKQWRFFFLEKNDGWALKYIRIYRTERGLVVCNGDSRALKRETLNKPEGINEYD